MRFQEIENVLSGMLQISTISGKGNEQFYEIQRYKAYLKEMFPNVFKQADVTRIGDALIIKLVGKDNTLLPVLFLGHMDVVPILHETEWKYPPFSGAIADGCIWGRGAQDMKSAQCALLAAWEQILTEEVERNRSVFLYLSCDEEIGGMTTHKAAEYFKEQNIRFQTIFDEGGIICENYLQRIPGKSALLGIAEKGSLQFRITAKAAGGHAANPPKGSAIVRLANFIMDIENSNPFRRKMAGEIKEMLRTAAGYMADDDQKQFLAAIEEETPYQTLFHLCADAQAMLGATIAFTMIHGGTAFNVMPASVELVANVRVSSVQSAEEVEKILEKTAERYHLQCTLVNGNDASFVTGVHSWGYNCLRQCMEEMYQEMPLIPFVLNGGTDSKHFQKLTEEIIRFSPIYASPEQGKGVHGDNEYVSIDALREGAEFYFHLIKNYL